MDQVQEINEKQAETVDRSIAICIYIHMFMQVCMYATHGIVIPYIASKAQCVIFNGLYYNEMEMYFDIYSTKERISTVNQKVDPLWASLFVRRHHSWYEKRVIEERHQEIGTGTAICF